MRYIFANCELDTQCYRLRRADLDVPLRPKAFHLLVYLIEPRDRVVSKQELCDHIWKERFVSDATVENSVKLVRQAVVTMGAHSALSKRSIATGIALWRPSPSIPCQRIRVLGNAKWCRSSAAVSPTRSLRPVLATSIPCTGDYIGCTAWSNKRAAAMEGRFSPLQSNIS